MLRDEPNLGALWARLVVDTLITQGVRRFVVAPGSRSSPLVRAVVEHARAEAVLWIDERGAAFHALGWARATGQPAAVVTTSGTAVANLLPAVVEASQDAVPLVLLTADRPPELIDVGANQAIRQPGIFGSYARWSVDLPCPSADVPARYVVSMVVQAVGRSLRPPEGPVHLNCRFREPLAPEKEPWDAACLAGVQEDEDGSVVPGIFAATDDEPPHLVVQELLAAIQETDAGLLIAAGPCDSDVAALAAHLGWPLYADVRSGHRLGTPRTEHMPYVDHALGHAYRPDTVLQLGARITSKRLLTYLGSGEVVRHVVIDAGATSADPNCGNAMHLAADPAATVDLLLELLDDGRSTPPDLPAKVVACDQRVMEAIDETLSLGPDDPLTEPAAVRWLTEAIDPAHAFFVSNSMPIRDMQTCAVKDGPPVPIGCNRGASGIDGILSTAAGFAAGHNQPTTVIIGDQAFLHDLNALASLAREPSPPLAIVVMNNGGGSIFSFLPLAQHESLLTPWFDAAHDFDFEGVCHTFGIPWRRVSTLGELRSAYDDVAQGEQHAVIEVNSSLEANRQAHLDLQAATDAAARGRKR